MKLGGGTTGSGGIAATGSGTGATGSGIEMSSYIHTYMTYLFIIRWNYW